MRAIQANPKTIRQIFTESYIIPEFLDSYSWEAEQCDKLFEDIADFFRQYTDAEDKYYLGSIVICRKEENWVLIDGQQRLTSLMLFLNALRHYTKNDALKQYIETPDQKPKVSFHVESVQGKSESLILGDIDIVSACIKKNYEEFLRQIQIYFLNSGAGEAEKLTQSILDRVILLPVECRSIDDALTVAASVEQSRAQISDADIFYTYLFNYAKEKEGCDGTGELALVWNTLLENASDPDPLFCCLMHIKRAESGEIDEDMDMRAYFAKHREIFENWREVFEALNKINCIWSFGYTEPVSPEVINICWLLRELSELYGRYWRYPIAAFWFKYAEKQDDSWILPAEKQADMERLYKETLRYYYLNAVAYNNIAYIRNTTALVCKAIWAGEDYAAVYADNSGKADEARRLFEENIRTHYYGRVKDALVYLLSFLNPRQNQKALSEVTYDVEPILPNESWNDYKGWTEVQYNECAHTLGNYTALKIRTDIQGRNWFSRKKKKYVESAYQDARDLCALDDWTYEEWQKREREMEARLFKFFGIKPKDAQSAE